MYQPSREGSHCPSSKWKSISSTNRDQLQGYRSVYEQLPVNSSQTRVMILHSHSSDSALVSCSLEVMTLNPNPSKVYTALSYVWGDASITEEILVNGVSFAVASNLASALRQIGKSFGKVVLWADAISINQKDTLERNQQVLLMNVIYSKAERVLGWLGQDENGGGQALRTLEDLFSNVMRYPNNFEWVQKMPDLFTLNSTHDAKGFQTNEKLEKVWLLLDRPYWKRIWIVQEVVMPMDLRLMCGEDFTDVPEPYSFKEIVKKLTKGPNQRPQSVPLILWLRLIECVDGLDLLGELKVRHLHRERRASHIWDGAFGFLRTRISLEFHKTSDPRDHVYGLLGLIDLDIVPDYSENKNIADVYLEVARQCLRSVHLDILSFAGIRNRAACSTQTELPSWVPDWRLPPPARVRSECYPRSHAFPSNGGLIMHVTDYEWLRGSAVLWDTVSRIEKRTDWDLKEWDLAESIDFEKPGDLAYPSGISRFEAFVMLWLGGNDGSKAKLSDLQLDGDLFQSYQTIFFAQVAEPWTNKHGLHKWDKMIHLIIGPNRLKSPSIFDRESYVTQSNRVKNGMRYFHTEKGYIGLGPLNTEVGDLVCVLEGHKAPVLLYGCGSHYHFVGDCDVVGIMNGEVLEAVKRGESEIVEIEIR